MSEWTPARIADVRMIIRTSSGNISSSQYRDMVEQALDEIERRHAEIAELKAGLAQSIDDRHRAADNGERMILKLEDRIAELESELHDAYLEMATQFGIHTIRDGRPCIITGTLSTLEDAFEKLGWDDPHYLEDKQ